MRNMPYPLGLGDAAQDAILAVIAAGGPCLQANVMLVCAAQAALGVKVDGKWGTDTSTAARSRVPNAPAGCSPRPTWWAPVGQSSCPIVPSAATIPTAVSPTVTPALAPAAVIALGAIDPCQQANVAIVCAAQKALGVSVDGKYGTDTATAARRVFAGAPPACSPRPSWWAPVGSSNCGSTVLPPVSAPVPVPATASVAVPAAVAALATVNPCLQTNVAIVYAAQTALGVAKDGKYGTDTAAAARRILPSAPAACSPRPSWWAPVGVVNPIVPGAATPPPATTVVVPSPVALPSIPSIPSAPTSTPSVPSTTPTTPAAQPSSGSTTPVVVAPAPAEKKGLSTGAMVVGGLALVAVVGVTAVALSKKGARGARGKRGQRGPVRRKKSHKRRK